MNKRRFFKHTRALGLLAVSSLSLAADWAPGSVRIVYRALGNTYTLTDDGAGNLKGNGSGTVSYLTGSVSVTLQALPDDRSAIVIRAIAP